MGGGRRGSLRISVTGAASGLARKPGAGRKRVRPSQCRLRLGSLQPAASLFGH